MNVASPSISVIVAVFNGKATLQGCIDSVARQTYLNKELIIIDGGSKDGTVELLKANNKHITYWVSEPDSGIYNAWNKGLAQARGEWICFLGADDYFWDVTVLEQMMVHLKMLPASIRVAYGKVLRINDDGQLHPIGESWEQVKVFFQQYMCIPHVGTMHRRTLFEQHGTFDESFRIAGDYELLLRELKTGDAAFISNIITTAQRLGGMSTDLGNKFRIYREVMYALRMHGRRFPSKRLLKMMVKDCLQLLLWEAIGDRMARKLLDLRRRFKGLPPYWKKS
ncbi:MAG: glycosyltransferase [Nitrospira sp. LK70]|nr:glycosyltransferase [Nitrospira sp. LK70]